MTENFDAYIDMLGSLSEEELFGEPEEKEDGYESEEME